MKRLCLLSAAVMIIGTVVVLTLSSMVLAHEDRTIGPYKLHVGWHVEPALTEQLNAIEVTVTQNGKAVQDVEKTLTLTLSTGGKTSDALQFNPSDEMPGLYTAALIPTVAGDYKLHFVGTIGKTPIDETFDSADGKIDPVERVTDLQFPEKEPSNAELQKEIDDLKAQITALKGNLAAPMAAATASR